MARKLSKRVRAQRERVDRTEVGDRSVELPCTGVFEMEDGKIKVWRDYFDLKTYTSALS